MQKNEVIIEKFVKAINESSIDVSGDPVILDKIFAGLAKKKKRKRIFIIFLLLSFVMLGSSIVIWLPGHSKSEYGNLKPSTRIADHPISIHIEKSTSSNDMNEKIDVVHVQKIKNKKGNKPDVGFEKSVTYKFNNHQVDVFKNGDEEFLQINVFGADGMEQDVFQIMEDLKRSYKSNEVYVDSVKHK